MGDKVGHDDKQQPQVGHQVQQQTVIIHQPAPPDDVFYWAPPNIGWMSPPASSVGNSPPGLESLAVLNEVYVRQYIELMEVLTGIQFRNKYSVQNAEGAQLLGVVEDSSLGQRLCCGPFRGFQMRCTNALGQTVILINRPFKYCAGCCWCSSPGNACSIEINVECPPGNVVGYVKQERYCCSPYLGIYDANNQFISAIRGPCCPCICPCFTLDYLVSNDRSGHQKTGNIQHIWAGFCHDYCTNADDFRLEFPPGADVGLKALMIGASIILDFMYFENKTNNN